MFCIKEHSPITLDDYIDELFSLYNITEELLKSEEFSITIQYIYILLDTEMRYNIRYKAISELINNGVKVDYFGNCEEDMFKYNDNFINHGPKDYTEILEIISKSKIVINDI